MIKRMHKQKQNVHKQKEESVWEKLKPDETETQ